MVERMIRTVAIVLSLVLVLNSDVGAQPPPDCGNTCQSCGTEGYEGRGFAIGGMFKMDCLSFVLWCTYCGDARTNAGANSEALLSALKHGEMSELRDIVAANSQRLSLVAGRRMVVLRGTKCDPSAIAAVVFVDAEQARRLSVAGVKPFVEVKRQVASR